MILEGKQAVQINQHAMGTIMTHRAFGPNAKDGLAAVCSEVERLEGLLSRFLPASDVSRINESAGICREKISRETYEVLARAAEFSRSCPGSFDITIEPLVALWKECAKTFTTPDEFSLRQVLSLVNHRDLILDPWNLTAGLKHLGQSVDLGGIGKGYAGDRIRKIFSEFEVTSAYANLGGNVVTLGAKPDGSAWRVGIQHPRQDNGLIGSVSVANQSVVTSGDYQRFFTDCQGIRRHHILDPESGYPAQAGLISVTIVSDNCMTADALSTIMFLAGIEKGLEYLRNYSRTGAILVDDTLRVTVTKCLAKNFQAAEGIEVTIVD